MKKLSVLLIFLLFAYSAFSRENCVDKIKSGEKQIIVVYGTSLSARSDGWPSILQSRINEKYPDAVEVVNSAKGAMWSIWGVQNLDERVLSKKPDMVLMEFAINDAYLPYNTSLEVCRINLEYMIGRIKEAFPDCEIVLQTMNMPIKEHLESRPSIESYYNLYRKVAKKYNLKLIDHYKYWADILTSGEDAFLRLVPDGIHPEEEAWNSLTVPFIMKKLDL